jgi:aconitate hydratase
MRYGEEGTPLVIIAGAEYGTGSSRDWAAKGSRLLGIRAIIAESFERIHRSNLVGMGVLPLQFEPGVPRGTLGLDGSEQVDLLPPAGELAPGMNLQLVIRRQDGRQQQVAVRCRIDTADEIAYFHSGGILHHVLRRLLKTS